MRSEPKDSRRAGCRHGAAGRRRTYARIDSRHIVRPTAYWGWIARISYILASVQSLQAQATQRCNLFIGVRALPSLCQVSLSQIVLLERKKHEVSLVYFKTLRAETSLVVFYSGVQFSARF
eukprot:5098968-Pleurochrysis_carterae.AAC.2